jgi:hypothetical protein
VARHFLFASIRSLSNQLNAAQLAEAMTQKQQLEKTRDVYSQNVAMYVALMNQRYKQTTKKESASKTWVEACTAQLQYEPTALANGGATITKRGPSR